MEYGFNSIARLIPDKSSPTLFISCINRPTKYLPASMFEQHFSKLGRIRSIRTRYKDRYFVAFVEYWSFIDVVRAYKASQNLVLSHKNDKFCLKVEFARPDKKSYTYGNNTQTSFIDGLKIRILRRSDTIVESEKEIQDVKMDFDQPGELKEHNVSSLSFKQEDTTSSPGALFYACILQPKLLPSWFVDNCLLSDFHENEMRVCDS